MELNAKEINTIDIKNFDFFPDKIPYLLLAKQEKIDFVYNTVEAIARMKEKN